MRQSSSRQATDSQSNDAPSAPSHPEPSAQNAELIARAAYQRYEARGREDGHDVDDWLAAERDTTGASTSEANTPRDDPDAA